MIHRVLKIGRWSVDFLFATDDYDTEGVLACLYEIYAPKDVMERAGRIMESGRYNRGFTFSNPELRRAVCVVGPTSSGAEFVNTASHEIHHVASAIANDIGYDLNGEFPAYVTGDAMQSLISVICELGCKKCHSTKAHR
jgi:hypothetical protein